MLLDFVSSNFLEVVERTVVEEDEDDVVVALVVSGVVRVVV